MNRLRMAAASLLSWVLCASAIAAGPRILYTDITSGPNSGGEGDNGAYLSIFGKGFGASRDAGTVTVGGGEAARYIVWSDERVSVQIGRAARSGDIVVATSGGSATAPEGFTVRPGNFYFIALDGSDRGGVKNDINRPFRTPNHVARELAEFAPGDFVVVRGGRYDLSEPASNLVASTFLRADKSGTAASPMAFLGYPGESVVIEQNQPNLQLFSNYVTISHWVVADFHASLNHCLGGNTLVQVGAVRLADNTCTGNIPGRIAYFRIVNLDVDGHDVGGMCNGTKGYADGPINLGYGDNIKILGNSIHNTGAQGGTDQRGHLIYIGATTNNVEIGWNRVHDIPHSRALIDVHTDDVGGNCYGHKRLTDITIHDNTVYNVAGQAIDLDGGTGDIRVYNNLIYNTPTADDHRYQDVIALRGSGGRLNATLYNNIVYANPNDADQGWMLGIGWFSGSFCPERLTLYDNVFYVTDPQDFYVWFAGNCGERGNISSRNNIWHGSKHGLPTFRGAGDKDVKPMFKDPKAGDFQVLKKSQRGANPNAAPK